MQDKAGLAAVGACPFKDGQVFDTASGIGVLADIDAGPEVNRAVLAALWAGKGILTGFGHKNNPFFVKKSGG